MPCQVPVFSLPFVIGIVTLAPIRALLMCALRDVSVRWFKVAVGRGRVDSMCEGKLTGISSNPSAECLYRSPFLSGDPQVSQYLLDPTTD